MSDANVIHDISATLRALLDERFKASGASGTGGAAVTVTVDSPHRGTHDELRVNLYLYNIVQDEGRRNIGGGWVPLTRTASSQTFAAEPLALRLYYLVTAFAVDGLTEHNLLGQAMQELYKNRRIPHDALKGTLKDSTLQKVFRDNGATVWWLPPEDFAAFQQQQQRLFAGLVKRIAASAN